MNTNDRKKLIAQVHIAKSQLGMDDDAYREMLARIGKGKTSSKDLSILQLRMVVTEMKAKGFRAKPARSKARPQPARSKEALRGKVDALLAAAGRPIEYADGMARKMFNVDKVDWLDADQLWRVVAALNYDARRRARGNHEHATATE